MFYIKHQREELFVCYQMGRIYWTSDFSEADPFETGGAACDFINAYGIVDCLVLETDSKLKLYLITQGENRGYDTYDSAVVAAMSEPAARQMHPGIGGTSSWTRPSQVNVTLIGVTDPSITGPTVICSSSNAG